MPFPSLSAEHSVPLITSELNNERPCSYMTSEAKLYSVFEFDHPLVRGAQINNMPI